MNTLFERKPALLGTWMHPATMRCHMIDYAAMCANQRMLCTDVQDMRGANSWTDHQLVGAKVWMKLFHTSCRKVHQAAPFAAHRPRCYSQPPLFTVSFAVHNLRLPAQRSQLLQGFNTASRRKAIHAHECTAEQNWDDMKSCILSAAGSTGSTIGRGR